MQWSVSSVLCLIALMCLYAPTGMCVDATTGGAPSETRAWREAAREASAIYDVPLVALTLLYEMEGGRLGAETPNRNKDGEITSYDIGPMQINSQHLRVVPQFEFSALSGFRAHRLA